MNELSDIEAHRPWPQPPFSSGTAGAAYRKDLRLYLLGFALAVILTAIPFGLVYWHALTGTWLFVTIGLFAIVQAMIHFRYFLHIRPPYENVDELLLVLFTVIILVMMAGGTIWILGNLHARMY